MTKLKTQPLKWHGGKSYTAPWIVGLMPPHLNYVEPYFGGRAAKLARDSNRDWMAVNGEKLPAHLHGASEVVNDINKSLASFWSVLGSDEDFPRFLRKVQAVPMSQQLWRAAASETEWPDPVEDAVQFFIRYRQSRQGLGKDFATLSRNRTRGGRNEQANAWLGCVEGLPEIHKRLKGVVIFNDDAIKVIKQEDGEHTLYYCDPPYLHENAQLDGRVR